MEIVTMNQFNFLARAPTS